MTTDPNYDLEAMFDAGSPAAADLDFMNANFTAVLLGPCPDCGAPFQPEKTGDSFLPIREHAPTCPA